MCGSSLSLSGTLSPCDVITWTSTGEGRSSRSSKSRDVESSPGTLTVGRRNVTNGGGNGSRKMGTGARHGEWSDDVDARNDTGGSERRCVLLTVGGAKDESSAQGSGLVGG